MSNPANRDRRELLIAALVTFAAGILYFLTAARDILVGDAPDLTTASATLGVAHEPGYPLFTMLGYLFIHIPVGSIPFRVNLVSVLCHAATVGVVYLTARRLTRSHLAALAAALLLAVNSIFWSWSLVAEAFPLNDLLAAISILFLIIWREDPGRNVFLILSAFAAGLGLTNHQTVVLIGPAYCLILWQQRTVLLNAPRLVVAAALALFIGLLPYAYIPWASSRHPAYNWGNVSSVSDFIDVVTRRTYGAGRLVAAPEYTGGSPMPRLLALVVSLGLTNLILVTLGLVAAWRQVRWYFWFGLTLFIFAGPVFIWMTNLNLATAPSGFFILQRFFLLPQVVVAPFAAFGFAWLAHLIGRVFRQRHAFSILAGAVTVVILLMIGTNYARIDQSKNFIERRFAEDLWKTVEPGSILLARGDVAFTMLYFQTVEHLGADSDLVLLPLLARNWYIRQLREQHPNLVLPFERYDGAENNLRRLVDANSARTVAIAGTIGNADHSLDKDYWPYQRGLLLVIEPRSKSIPFPQMIAENERWFATYHPPAPDQVRFDSLERDVVTIYSWPAYRIANDCVSVGLRDEAEKWYRRALEINPQFSEARHALSQIVH